MVYISFYVGRNALLGNDNIISSRMKLYKAYCTCLYRYCPMCSYSTKPCTVGAARERDAVHFVIILGEKDALHCFCSRREKCCTWENYLCKERCCTICTYPRKEKDPVQCVNILVERMILNIWYISFERDAFAWDNSS
jgi:hypothetical protein